MASHAFQLQLASAADNLDAANRGVSNGHRLWRTLLNALFPGFLPRIISPFIVCNGIIRNTFSAE